MQRCKNSCKHSWEGGILLAAWQLRCPMHCHRPGHRAALFCLCILKEARLDYPVYIKKSISVIEFNEMVGLKELHMSILHYIHGPKKLYKNTRLAYNRDSNIICQFMWTINLNISNGSLFSQQISVPIVQLTTCTSWQSHSLPQSLFSAHSP